MKCTVQIEFPCWTEINMQHKPQSCLNKQQLWILWTGTSVAAKTQKQVERAPPYLITQTSASFSACVDWCM